MKLIESARITGYQSHEATNLNFSSGLNVIVGDTDTGKSSILRALSFVLFNKPWHVEFMNREANEATVELRIGTDGHTNIITRRRSRDGKINDYVVDGCELSNFGRSVPVPVLEILGVTNQLFDTIYGSQHNPAFMLGTGFSGTERARRLVAFSDVLTIDTAIKVATKRESEYASEISALESQRDSKTEELSKLGDLIRIREIVDKCEILNNILLQLEGYESNEVLLSKLLYSNYKSTLRLSKITKYVEESSKLQTILNFLSIIDKEIKNLASFLVRKRFLDSVLPLVNEIAKIHKYKDTYIRLSNFKDELKRRLEDLVYNNIEIKQEKIKQYLYGIKKRTQTIRLQKCTLRDNKMRLKRIEEELHNHLKENEVCPLCNKKI